MIDPIREDVMRHCPNVRCWMLVSGDQQLLDIPLIPVFLGFCVITAVLGSICIFRHVVSRLAVRRYTRLPAYLEYSQVSIQFAFIWINLFYCFRMLLWNPFFFKEWRDKHKGWNKGRVTMRK